MLYVISIINPDATEVMADICSRLEIPLMLSVPGRGTANKSVRELLGIQTTEKRVVMTVADSEKTAALIEQQRRRIYIDAPGNGITISVPIKSMGGGTTMAYLSGTAQIKKQMPDINVNYELILVIANEGHTDAVMDAAKKAGAEGGTVLHAKGTGGTDAEKFFNVSIASEKELIMIVSKSSEKTAIMRSVLTLAGPSTEAGAVAFSLPVTDLAGFRITDE